MPGTIPFNSSRYVGNDLGRYLALPPTRAQCVLASAGSGIGRIERMHMMLICLALIQFSGAWIFPPKKFGSIENVVLEKPGGVLFQYLVWLGIISAIANELVKHSSERIVAVMRPILPMAVIGMLSTLLGYDPASSFRPYFLWLVMLLCAAVIGLAVRIEHAERGLVIAVLVLALASMFMAIVVPDIGMQADREARVWRGVFPGKNMFGWFASLALVIGLGFIESRRSRLAILLAACGMICTLASGSKGALVMAMSGAGYRLMLPYLIRRVTPPLGFVILVCAFILAALASQVLMPFVLEALGRDPSLTGRTDIWAAYFASMLRSPWIGSGLGAYTGLSPFTAVLAAKLANFGTILTPHNMYLGAFGDVGGIGLLIYVMTLGYFVFVVPLLHQSRAGFTCAGIGFLVMIAGFVETHEIFNAGIGGYCLMLTYSMTVSAARHAHDNRITQVADAATGGNSAGI